MDINQTTTSAPVQTSVSSVQGVFGTKIPATVAFAIAVLLFFMPFIDIKCNSMSLQTVSGFQLATGFKMKNSGSDNSSLNDKITDDTKSKSRSDSEKKDPNFYALIALALGVLGLGLSLTKSKPAS